MRSKAALGGHPLHPMLVAVPIGLAVWTLIAGIVYVVSDENQTWYDIAFWSGFATWVSALVAALPGLIDLIGVAIKSDSRLMALTHAGINVAVVALFALGTLIMWDEGALRGTELTVAVALHAIGVGLLAVSGWLGGEMVYRGHIAMVPDDTSSEQAELARHAEPRPS